METFPAFTSPHPDHFLFRPGFQISSLREPSATTLMMGVQYYFSKVSFSPLYNRREWDLGMQMPKIGYWHRVSGGNGVHWIWKPYKTWGSSHHCTPPNLITGKAWVPVPMTWARPISKYPGFFKISRFYYLFRVDLDSKDQIKVCTRIPLSLCTMCKH